MENVVLLVVFVGLVLGGIALYQRAHRRNLEQPFTEDEEDLTQRFKEDGVVARPSGVPQAIVQALSVQQKAVSSKPKLAYSSGRPLAVSDDPLPYPLPDAVDLVPLSISGDFEPVRHHAVPQHEPSSSYHHDTSSHSQDSYSSHDSHDSGGSDGGGSDGGGGGGD